MYAKQLISFAQTKTFFLKYQAQVGGVNHNPPWRTPLRRCDVSVKQIFRIRMKTLLHYGFG